MTRTFEGVFGQRPDLYEPYRAFADLFWQRRLVDPVVLELCRLRVAQLLGCESEQAVRHRVALDAGLTEQHVERLSDWPTAAGFTEAQRAALAFAEQFVIDSHGIDQAMRDGLEEHFTLPEVVALTEALVVFDGFTRFRLLLTDDTAEPVVVDLAPPPAEPPAMPADADPAISHSVLGEQPETLVAFLRLYGTLWSHGRVDHPLKEIARLRNARITDCGY